MTTEIPAPEPEPRHRRVRAWWFTALVASIVVLLVAEIAVRLADDRLGEPLVWYSQAAQNKAKALTAENRQPANVVFVGSSVVMASLDPGRFMENDRCSRSAYNAATPGAVPTITADWLERLVLPELRPDLVVVGIAPRDLSRDAANAQVSYFGSLAVRDDVGARAERWFGSWSELVRYRTMLRSPRRLKGRVDELRGATADVWTFDRNGFTQRDDANASDSTVQVDQPGMRIDREQVAALDDLVSTLIADGVTPVLAAMGNSERWNSTPMAAKLAEEEGRILEQLADRHDVAMIDLRSVSDPSEFVDLVHTNRAGSRRETDLLTEALSDCPG